MKQIEIYNGLRLLVNTYIEASFKEELLEVLDQREKENLFPPGKAILSSMISNSNGIQLKEEHKELYQKICELCI